MQNVSIENGNFLNVQIDGDIKLPKVMLSNSLGADTRMWDAQVNALKDKFCIIRYGRKVIKIADTQTPPYFYFYINNK